MKKLIPEIFIDRCDEALLFYKAVFGGDVRNVKTADGMEMFKGFEGKIIHAELHINDDCVIYLVDGFDRKKGDNITLILDMESEEEIDRIYQSLQKEGSVKLELQKTFWGALHAVVTDRFGVTWALNYALK